MNLSEVEALGQYDPTDAEIAAALNITEAEAKDRRENDPEFRQALERGRTRRSLALKQSQTKKALSGSVSMLRSLSDDPLKAEGDRRLAEYLAKVAPRG